MTVRLVARMLDGRPSEVKIRPHVGAMMESESGKYMGWVGIWAYPGTYVGIDAARVPDRGIELRSAVFTAACDSAAEACATNRRAPRISFKVFMS